MVNAGLDLQRTENELVLRVLVGHQLAVVGTIGAGGEPVAHVVLVVGSVGEKEHELFALLARQAHDDVVWLHRPLGITPDLGGDGEQVFPIVKRLHVFDMVEPVHDALDAEDSLRIADMGSQPLGHGAEWSE